MKDELYIGIDNGTQGTKCAVYSLAGRKILSSAYRPHTLISNAAGRREQDPDMWIAAASEALEACLAHPDVRPQAVVALAVSGQQHGMVPLDRTGRVLRPAKLWCDTETVAECQAITEAMGGEAAVRAAIGNRIAAGFTASKVRWFRQHEPRLYDRLDGILLPHDYLNYWLTGARVTECGDASGTAYFDVRRRCWSEALLRAIDSDRNLGECLPKVIGPDETAGRLRPALAAQFGLSPRVRVAAGGGDNMMAAIGTGNVRPGVVTASLGTSGTIYAFADRPVVDPAGELAAFCSSNGGWLPLVCTMNVTVATERTRELLGLDVQAFDAQVASAPPGAGGLLWLPYFNGERTPDLPRASATLGGITSDNLTPAMLCRAAMEGATLGLRYALNVLRRQHLDVSEIRLVGGGANSAVWRRMAADVLNCPVIRPQNPEAGVMGCVVQAMACRMKAAGHPVDWSELTDTVIPLDPASRVEPQAAAAEDYDAVYQRYLAFNDTLAPTFRAADARS